LTASINLNNNVSCNGGADGSATASGSGGTSPYTFAWSNSGTGATQNTLSAGTYTVTVTDANGCTDTEVITITEPTVLFASAVVDSNTTCASSATGVATASGSGGTSPYTYLWSSGSTSSAASGLGTGTYCVTVTDANGCTDTACISIVVEDTVSPVVLTQNVNAYLDASGLVSISSNDVDNGSTDDCGIASMVLSDSTFDCSDLGSPLNVTLTVTDVNGNSSSGTATVTVLDTVAPNVSTLTTLTVYLNTSGVAFIDTNDLNNGSNDNCGIADMWMSQSSFFCGNAGSSMMVTLYVQR
jgi:hypothetical protein